MLHPCYLSTLVNRQRPAGTQEGILSTQADGLPDRDLYADHIYMCTRTYAKHTSGELRVALFLYTSSYAVSHRSLPLAHGHTETHTALAELHISMSCFFRHSGSEGGGAASGQ